MTGGRFEDSGLLKEFFKQFGAVVQVTVRHREEEAENEDGEMKIMNTSWAMVTMEHVHGVERALAARPILNPHTKKEFVVTNFDEQQAGNSTGGMVQTLKCVDDEHERLSLCDDHFKRICASDLPCAVAYDLKRQDDPNLMDAQNPDVWPSILQGLSRWTAGKPELEMAVDQSVRTTVFSSSSP